MRDEISREMAAKLLPYFAEREEQLLAFVRELVEAESPSGDVAGSRAVAELVSAAAKKIDGIGSVERIESKGYGEHLRLSFFVENAKEQGRILLVGHTDTVHARGSLKERPWRVEGGRIYAPGIFDMKANCALALEILNACSVLKLKPSSEVVLLLTCDEETGSETGRALVEAEAQSARCAFVLEPPASGGRVKTGRKGTGIFTMEVTGRAAHAGLEPEKGASAILELARQVERLHALNHPQSGVSVNVGVVAGGTRSNVVAAEARAEIDMRFSSADEGQRIENEILRARPFDERVQVRVSGGINRPPLERNEGTLALYEQAKKVARALDFELEETQVGGASDGNFIAAPGVPVLDGLGVDGDGAHAAHENIIIEDIKRRGALLAGLLLSI
ncbi:MAG: M20 family metallopeptidase [Acidobacteria bacterium]|nr:M20 family metallopeptidase [Acidobacteriota bacterium]